MLGLQKAKGVGPHREGRWTVEAQAGLHLSPGLANTTVTNKTDLREHFQHIPGTIWSLQEDRTSSRLILPVCKLSVVEAVE